MKSPLLRIESQNQWILKFSVSSLKSSIRISKLILLLLFLSNQQFRQFLFLLPMQQSRITHEKVKFYEKSHESFHLNRLVQCIDNKNSSSSHKLKEILKKTDRLNCDRQTQMQSIEKELKLIENMYNQSIAVNTKEIFVGKNKTQLESPKAHNFSNKKNPSIFMSKNIFQNLQETQKCVSLSSRLKQKLNPTTTQKQKSKKKRKDGFPHLAMPKIKRPVQFDRYQDEPTRYPNCQIINLQSNKLLKAKSFQRSSQRESIKNQNLIVQHRLNQRKHFNESLQKLIQKAFKNQNSKISTNQNSRNFIETIQECDATVIGKEQQKPRGLDSLYAEKDRLLSNPDLKIMKSIKRRSTEKTCIQTPATMRNPQSALSLQKQPPQSSIQIQSKKRIIHTNRDSYYIREALKLKTQILSTSKTQKERQYFYELIQRLQDYPVGKSTKVQSKSINMRKRIIQKTKTMQPELANIKTLTKWEIVGYDSPQSSPNHRQSNGIQKYMQNLAKKSAKKTFYKKPLELKTKFNFNDFQLPNVTTHK